MRTKPHYVREFRRLMRTMQRRNDSLEGAISESTGGGDRDEIGRIEYSILRAVGLGESDYLIDVGCGSGCLAETLKAFPRIRFLGIDVVPEMVAFARERCDRPDWRFNVVEGLTIPEDDGLADYVSFFSVLTHLTPDESLAYLQDAKRVLKPGGKILASYLDRNVSEHRHGAGGWLHQLAHRGLGLAVKNTLADDQTMLEFGRRLGMDARIIDSPLGHKMCLYTKA